MVQEAEISREEEGHTSNLFTLVDGPIKAFAMK